MRREDSGLLLYTVAGDHFASPLAELREVVDVEWTEQGAAPIEDSPGAALIRERRVELIAMEEILDLETPRFQAGIRPMLVVETPKMWVGLLVDSVHGMVPAEGVRHLPGGLSVFPDELILGMFQRKMSTQSRVSAAATRSTTVEGWMDRYGPAMATHERGEKPEAAAPADEEAYMILVLDLAVLATVAAEGYVKAAVSAKE